MDFIQKYNVTPIKVLKAILIIAIALVVLTVLMSTLNTARNKGYSMGQLGGGYDSSTVSIPTAPSMGSGNMVNRDGYAYEEMGAIPSTMPPVPGGGYTSGDSEEFEVTDYSATIETQNLDADCERISSLKSRSDIIFESANEYDRGCSFSFKAKKESVTEVLGILQSMNPRELVENTYTIKSEVDNYTSEIEILKRKLDSLDATLQDAITAYNDITNTAKTIGDAETLARIIESKLSIIERLTNARIQTVSELDRYETYKRDALDRMTYTHFTVSVYENRYVNGEDIKDSWKREAQQFFNNANALVQDLSIGLVYMVLAVAKFAIYFFVLLFVVRFGWSATKHIWMNGEKREDTIT